jgi:hypothetical protein
VSKVHNIASLLDMLKLSPEEFARMVPDLILWHAICHSVKNVPDVEPSGRFEWHDDGKPGEIHSIRAVLTKDGEETGVTEVWAGSAYDGQHE